MYNGTVEGKRWQRTLILLNPRIVVLPFLIALRQFLILQHRNDRIKHRLQLIANSIRWSTLGGNFARTTSQAHSTWTIDRGLSWFESETFIEA